MPQTSLSERLNQSCFCRRTDYKTLSRVLADGTDDLRLFPEISSRPGLFSDAVVYLPQAAIQRMEATTRAIENVTRLPGFRERVFSYSPEIARRDPGPTGVFMGYDFHVSGSEPQLIEVNTNAGGAFVNAVLATAQRACCTDAGLAASSPLTNGFPEAVYRMFVAEWRKQGREDRPECVAIVDDHPEAQYLYPDMLLAQRLLREHGIKTIIADAGELSFENGVLQHGGISIDLVYNRLTDFALDQSSHASLRAAYDAGAVVVTPNPTAHALFADKRNLTILSEEAQLRSLGASEPDIETLAATIPRTVSVTSENAAPLWKDRRRLFFKPSAGYGSKATYRGDKVTQSVWKSILAQDYVAQAFTPPGARTIRVEGANATLKADIRLFRYDGETLLLAARLYQGQTTNFRTIGGGFAPVFVAG